MFKKENWEQFYHPMFPYLLHGEDGEKGKDVKTTSENLSGWICIIFSCCCFSTGFIHCSCFCWKRVSPHFHFQWQSIMQGGEKNAFERTLSCVKTALMCTDSPVFLTLSDAGVWRLYVLSRLCLNSPHSNLLSFPIVMKYSPTTHRVKSMSSSLLLLLISYINIHLSS